MDVSFAVLLPDNCYIVFQVFNCVHGIFFIGFAFINLHTTLTAVFLLQVSFLYSAYIFLSICICNSNYCLCMVFVFLSFICKMKIFITGIFFHIAVE